MYDFLIVGSGLFGSVCARELTDSGCKCLVIDKRNHIGGNCYTENENGVNVHKYGPHIFNTSNKIIWDWINHFSEFNQFVYSPLAKFKNEVYSLPFNMWTFHQLWGVSTPEEARLKIESQRHKIENPKNLEEQSLSMVGSDIYFKLIKGYTEKQWGKKAIDLPADIIKRIPIRFTYDNNYYYSRYQGIPIGGYTKMFERILDGIPVELNVDFLQNRKELTSKAVRIIYTGRIDEYFNYCFGDLEYKNMRFEKEYHTGDYQGVAGVNYTEYDVPWTRIIEHKHFEFIDCQSTIITKEYSTSGCRDVIPMYPVNDFTNNELCKKYQLLLTDENNISFGGRLADYKYYNMDVVILKAIELSKNLWTE